MSSPDAARAREIVGWYTLIASSTGAVPVPAASGAIVANNALMLGHVAAAMRQPVTWQAIVSSLGLAGSLNILGRNVFIEGAKTLGWGTGSIWALAALSALGATTAGLQTYAIGLIAIEVCRNGGIPISPSDASSVFNTAQDSLSAFVAEMKKKNLKNPASEPVHAAIPDAPLQTSDGSTGPEDEP